MNELNEQPDVSAIHSDLSKSEKAIAERVNAMSTEEAQLEYGRLENNLGESLTPAGQFMLNALREKLRL